MAKITVKDLLKAGAHFGHQTKRWNPKMKPYVYGSKGGVSIIDITKTMYQLSDACNFLQNVIGDGGEILFVGTKRQAQEAVRETAESTKMYYITERWLGGTMTNNKTIRNSIHRMEEIDELLESDEAQEMRKKELSSLRRKSEKIHRNLEGVRDMKKMPAAMVVVDVCKEDIAVKEANKLKIPVVAMVDTNADPDNIDYPIVANDDAVKSIKLIIEVIRDAVKVASEVYHKRIIEEEKQKKEKAEAEKKKKEAEKKKKAEKKAKDEKKSAEEKQKKSDKKAPAKKSSAEKKKAPAKKGLKSKKQTSEKSAEEKQKKSETPEKDNKKATAKKKAPAKKAAAKKNEGSGKKTSSGKSGKKASEKKEADKKDSKTSEKSKTEKSESSGKSKK